MSRTVHYDDDQQQHPKESSKCCLPISTTLGARIVTLACLIVSLVILKTNVVKEGDFTVYTYKKVDSYRYALYAMVLSFVYTVLQIPFAIYYAKTGKYLINHHYVLEFDFYADKVNSLLLATATGALFGATMDVKKLLGNNESKYQDFFSLGYIAAAFLLVGFITAAVSSVMSSFALSRRG